MQEMLNDCMENARIKLCSMNSFSELPVNGEYKYLGGNGTQQQYQRPQWLMVGKKTRNVKKAQLQS